MKKKVILLTIVIMIIATIGTAFGETLGKIEISPTSSSINVRDTVKFTPVCKDQGGNDTACPTLVWDSDQSVGSIDSTGLFTAISEGVTDVTVSDGTVMSNVAKVMVAAATQTLTTIIISPTSATVIVGNTKQFNPTCKDQNDGSMTCPTLIWSSSSPSVGSIDSTGLFTAILEGMADVTVSDGTITSGPSVVTVKPVPINLVITSFAPNSATIEDTAPSNIKFSITLNMTANIAWNLDGVSTPGGQSVTSDSYRTNIPTVGSHVLTVTAQNGTDSVSKKWDWNVRGKLDVSAHPSFVSIGQLTNVTLKVSRRCGIESSDDINCTGTRVPVSGASISLTGIVTGGGVVNGTTGELVIPINTTSNGTINVTARKSGYLDNYTNIIVGIAPTPTPKPSSGSNSGSSSSGSSSSGSSSGGGGGGGGGSAEPYENIYKYEIQEHPVSTIPVSFKYVTPDLVVYDILLTSNESNTATLRVEILKDTSRLVGMRAPGIVYKNLNVWIDYKRIKNATIKYKIETSWMAENGLSEENIRMNKWNNNSKIWIELPTSVAGKDSTYTYFESQTESFSSFAISGMKEAPITTIDSVTPSITTVENTSPVPINANLVKSKGYTRFEIVIIAIVAVLVFYVLRIKKKE